MIENLPDEKWLYVAGYEGRYLVSNMGRVMSLARSEPKILKPLPNSMGYPQVGLCKDGLRKAFLIHRLVVTAFNPIAEPDLFEVNHKNFIITDARLENLEWCTHEENLAHYLQSGRESAGCAALFGEHRKIIGANHHLSKLTDNDVLEIRRLCSTRKHGVKREVARRYGINIGTLDQIVSGKTWKHLLPA